MKPDAFVDLFGRLRASAILRTNNQEKAARAMEAAVRGGFRIIEFTLTVPGVFELVQDFSFLVSPVVDTGVIAAARDLGVASMPGTHTPTEMLQAHRAGAELCKLFPAPAGGPAWVRAVLGPMPYLKIVPTNGVTPENATDWLDAGVFAAGFVAPLFDANDIARGDWDAIEARARRCIRAMRVSD